MKHWHWWHLHLSIVDHFDVLHYYCSISPSELALVKHIKQSVYSCIYLPDYTCMSHSIWTWRYDIHLFNLSWSILWVMRPCFFHSELWPSCFMLGMKIQAEKAWLVAYSHTNHKLSQCEAHFFLMLTFEQLFYFHPPDKNCYFLICMCKFRIVFLHINPLTPKNVQHLISPYNISPLNHTLRLTE